MTEGWVAMAWFAVGWTAAGFVNGITGFGAAMVAMPFVLVGMDITLAAPACSLLVLVMSLEQYWRYHGHVDKGRIVPVLIGAIPGALLGVLALQYFSAPELKGILGAFLLCYVAWSVWGQAAVGVVVGPGWGYVAGFFATLFGTAFSINGPPIAVYVTLTGWDKLTMKAGLAVCFVVTTTIMIITQMMAGLHSAATFTALAVGLPGSIAGAYLGFKVSNCMSENFYRQLVFLLLGATGVMFVLQWANS